MTKRQKEHKELYIEIRDKLIGQTVKDKNSSVIIMAGLTLLNHGVKQAKLNNEYGLLIKATIKLTEILQEIDEIDFPEEVVMENCVIL